jgi:hypothetical protein
MPYAAYSQIDVPSSHAAVFLSGKECRQLGRCLVFSDMCYMLRLLYRSDLKNVFWPNVFVGASFQILEIHQYSFGLKRGPASTLNQNPIFEMASIDLKNRRKLNGLCDPG